MLKKFSIFFTCCLAFVLLTSESDCGVDESQENAAFNKKKENVQSLMSNQPGTPIDFSMDRFLLNERNVRFNDPNKMSYLYIVLLDGTWLKVTIVGKLASTSKRLTRPEEEYYLSLSSANQLGPSPDEMGTYGSSDPARVGMLTLGSLIEFGGFSSYIYSEVPLSFSGLQRPVIEIAPIELNQSDKKMLLDGLNELKKQSENAKVNKISEPINQENQ